ncbi:MAG: hypothetical protein JO257_21915 [Deltaproteobacteria bacterium]|nr:hypothetical protein [Deltaproteobacteria bacterium]
MGACGQGGGHTKAHDDAAPQGSDAAPSVGTDVSGVLSGTAFKLQYAAVNRGPLTWVCVSNVMLTYAECSGSGGPARIMVLGPYAYDQNGAARWSLPQLGLYRVGASPVSEMAVTGTLMVMKDDAATGDLQLTMNVNFGETPATSGAVAITP